MRGSASLAQLRRALAAAVALVGVIAGAAIGCEVAVSSDLGAVHCTAEGAVGPPACHAGEYCTSGLCAPCRGEEVCGDGLDNDCNAKVDDGCPDLDAAVEAEAGADPGGACTAACAGALSCIDLALLGAGEGAVCSRSCCTSADCGGADAGAVCWPTPSGGAICRKAADVGRAVPGAGGAGSACTKDVDCRSGACDPEARVCADTCCTDTSCQSSVEPSCVLRDQAALAGGRLVWACGPQPGGTDYLKTCSADADCKSGLCVTYQGMIKVCSKPCCTSDECGEVNVPLVGTLTIACAYAQHGANGEWVRACSGAFKASSPQGNGKPCASDAECRSDHCDAPDAGPSVCADTCCSDDSCGDPTSFVCRPLASGGGYVLRCQRR